jgi:hypothetical protein
MKEAESPFSSINCKNVFLGNTPIGRGSTKCSVPDSSLLCIVDYLEDLMKYILHIIPSVFVAHCFAQIHLVVLELL